MTVKIPLKHTNQHVSDPRQDAFKQAYYNTESLTYSNALQSALAVGYSQSTAKDLLHNRPAWLSEKWGEAKVFEPDELLAKLSAIIEDGNTSTRDKLRAIELMMKNRGMLKDRVEIDERRISIESVLD
jgi:hypothetical protein